MFLRLVAGVGVEGDAHAGATIRHRSRLERTPHAPNLRQVHLVQSELFEELAERGFMIAAGDIGENVTTADIDLLGLPRGTVLQIGDEAAIEITGLRNPCSQLDRFAAGLMSAVLYRDSDGTIVRKCGVMGIVVADGTVRPGDGISIHPPAAPFEPLAPV